MPLDTIAVREIDSDLEELESDRSLADIANFIGRAEAIDRIELFFLGPIENALDAHGTPANKELKNLKGRAEQLVQRLELANAQYIGSLRDQIKSGSLTGKGFRVELEKYRYEGSTSGDYDGLDLLVGGLFRLAALPQETRTLEPEMIPYQPTPARIILELAKLAITPHDVFFDLGSGLGHVCMLIGLLTGARTIGIEFEPAYCDYSKACARELNLTHVEFVNADVRTADFSTGTIFFLYTPFRGSMLDQVLLRLRRESASRVITICAYGPCTLALATQSWLARMDQNPTTSRALAIFKTTSPARR
jgi:SAM-dependent methyltransferase